MTIRELIDELWGQDQECEIRLHVDPEGSLKETYPVYGIVYTLPRDDRGILWIKIEKVPRG